MAEKTPPQKKAAFLRLFSRLFGDREVDVDESFVVGVDFLRKVLKSLSSGSDKWWVEEESANSVVLGHCANGTENAQVAALLIRVPKITPRRVCLHWTAQETVQKGQYKLGARTVEDPEEIDRFWGPLRNLLAECYLWQRKIAKRESLTELKERRVTLEDCTRSDGQHLTTATQEFLMRDFLIKDLDHSAHKVLTNEDGFVTDGRSFAKAFRELTQKGCNPEALAQSVGHFKSYEAARGTKEGRDWSRFPSSNELIKLSDMLSELAREVIQLEENYRISAAVVDLNKYSKMVRNEAERMGWNPTEVLSLETNDLWSLETQFEDMAHSMETYATILKLWKPPRSDSIRVYGLIAPLVYTEIATGKPQYGAVASLLQSCTGTASRDKYTDTTLLKKRLKYFQKNFPAAFAELKSRLESAHDYTGPSHPPVDFDSALKNLEKSK